MPLDGAALAGVVHELRHILVGGRVDKVSQPEPDEIVLSVRAGGENRRLLLTANAQAPRTHLTALAKASPLQAPVFCMVLRKHLGGGRILNVRQPDFERIVEFEIENRTEMGDLARKTLLVEIMGKHSNIILTDANGKVLDAVKHVPPSLSAVRTVLPGVAYVRPPSKGKRNPMETAESGGLRIASALPGYDCDSTVQAFLFQGFNGISPMLANEICARAGVHPDTLVQSLDETRAKRVEEIFTALLAQVADGDFFYQMYYDDTGKAVDITPWPFLIYAHHRAEPYDSPSVMLDNFYVKRDAAYRLQQRTMDLRKVVSNLSERCQKKIFAHERDLAEVQYRDGLRIMGELLTAYLHRAERGAGSLVVENFYDGNALLEIPLDPTLTPAENAQRYFRRYNKQKRAAAALQALMAQNAAAAAYLESVAAALQNAAGEEDIAEIRAELAEQGYIKRRPAADNKRQKQRASKPLRYKSSDGFDIYVGKNNTQNDQLTLHTAHATDIWLHAKDIAGSHVILVTRGAEPPERTLLEAANLAAWYSRARGGSNVPVDYAARKHVRKPAGAKPGFVIYDFHKTVYVTPEEPALELI